MKEQLTVETPRTGQLNNHSGEGRDVMDVVAAPDYTSGSKSSERPNVVVLQHSVSVLRVIIWPHVM